MAERRFLAWLFGTAFFSALLVAVFCFEVDPYLVFGRPRLAGINDIKTAVTRHEPMMKAYQASRSCGKTIILGSSRSGVGLDPDSPSWPAALRPVYNLSVAGTNLDDSLHLLMALLADCNAEKAPTLLIVGLDFESFLNREPAPGGMPALRNEADREQDDRLRSLAQRDRGTVASSARLWKDSAVALLTIDALADSVSTVIASVQSAGADVLTNGKSSEWMLRQWTLADGPDVMFRQKHTLTARRFSGHHRLELASGGPAQALAPVAALLDLAGRHKMAVRLGVQPSHATHHELMDALGYWQDFERWKGAIADAALAGRQSGVDVIAWDFGGYETAFQEPVAPPGDKRTPMATFWDPVHYNTALGDRIIANLAGGAPPDTALGVELRPDTIAQRHQQVRRDRADWRQAHPEVVAQVLRYRCSASACLGTPPQQ